MRDELEEAVRKYLEALQAVSSVKEVPKDLDSEIERLQSRALTTSDVLQRLKLLSERRSLEALGPSLKALEDASAGFIKHAAEYGSREGIQEATWREIGIPPEILLQAGISTKRTQHQIRKKSSSWGIPVPKEGTDEWVVTTTSSKQTLDLLDIPLGSYTEAASKIFETYVPLLGTIAPSDEALALTTLDRKQTNLRAIRLTVSAEIAQALITYSQNLPPVDDRRRSQIAIAKRDVWALAVDEKLSRPNE